MKALASLHTLRIGLIAALAASAFGCSPQDDQPLPGNNDTLVAGRPWKLVYTGDNDGSSAYVDPTSIIKGKDYVEAWVLQDYRQPQNLNGDQYLSTVARMHYWCGTRMFTAAHSYTLSGNMGQGTVVNDDHEKVTPIEAPAISFANFELAAVCDNTYLNMSHALALTNPYRWTQIYQNNDDVIYAAKNDIATNGTYKDVWFMQDFKPILDANGKEYVRGDGGNTFKSRKYRVEYDCENNQHRVTYDAYFADHMGAGVVRSFDDRVDDWTQRQSNADDAAAWSVACPDASQGAGDGGMAPNGGDAITYDPSRAARQEILDRQLAEMETCIDTGVQVAIQRGVKSRETIKAQLQYCTRAIDILHYMSPADEEAMYSKAVDDAIDGFLSQTGQQ